MEYSEQLKREIPKGWKISTVESYLDKVPNTIRIQTSDYKATGMLPIIDQSTDFIAGYCDDLNANIQTQNGAIVFGDHTRIVKFIDFNFARGADGTQIILTNDEEVMPQLLFFQIINGIDLSNYGYARHYKFLKDTLMVIPQKLPAQHYKQIVKPMFSIIREKVFENLELSKLRDWLLPMLMNGQTTVE